jgi:division/cell wall cluster transcriptional repressor MraZ
MVLAMWSAKLSLGRRCGMLNRRDILKIAGAFCGFGLTSFSATGLKANNETKEEPFIYYSTIHPDGRIIIPQLLRNKVKMKGYSNVYITLHVFDDCINIYSQHEWDCLKEKINKNLNGPTKGYAEYFIERVISSVQGTKIDNHGRMFVSDELRNHVGIGVGEDIIILDRDRKIEIWSMKKWYPEKFRS